MTKVALITGAGRGIGLAIAKCLIAERYAVGIMDIHDPAAIEDALTGIREQGEVLYYQGSTTSDESRKGFVEAVLKRFGRIDVLVNNAGVAPKVRQDLLTATEESFDYVVGVNVKGTMFMTQEVARAMLEQEKCGDEVKGVIVNISSFSATVSSPNRPEYCISKAGVSMLTKLFADRLAGEGIYVYEVQPGVIRTDMTKTVQEKYDRLLAGTEFPIHRWGSPEDVANAVRVLVTGNLAYTTGQVIHVDGGYINIRTI